MTTSHWDSIIIGGNAAGLSAAQALGRSLRRTLVIDAGNPRNRFASHMHNIAALDGASPDEFLARGRADAERYGVEFATGTARAVRDAADGALITVELESGETFAARSLVVATGVTDLLPDVPGLAERWGQSVLHCPYCHGWEVRGRKLAVLAVSPLSLHQAKLIRQWSDDYTVFTAGLTGADGQGGLDAHTERALLARGTKLVSEPVVEVRGEAPRIDAVVTADGTEHDVDAIFVMSEMRPQDAFLAGLELARADGVFGSTIVVDAAGKTSHPRIWAAGNVVTPTAPVPMAMSAGTMAGATANMLLVEEDFAHAVAGDAPVPAEARA